MFSSGEKRQGNKKVKEKIISKEIDRVVWQKGKRSGKE